MVNLLSNPVYLLSPLITAAVSLTLLALVLLKSRRTFDTWLFCYLLLSVASVSLLLFGMRSSPDVERALPWDKAVAVAGFAGFLFYYHFTRAFTNTTKGKGVLYAAYLLLVVVVVLSPTDLFIKGMRLEDYGYAPITGPLSPLLFGMYTVLVGVGIYTLVRGYRRSTSYDAKNRMAYLAIAGLFPITAGFLDAFSNLPPASMWGYLSFCLLCTVAILKYHLLDIRVVLRRGLAYLLTSALVAVPFVVLLVLPSLVLAPGLEPWWYGFIILLLAIILRPLYGWAQVLVDKLFYRERYDYLKALQQFSRQAQSIVNIEDLGSSMVRLVSGALRTKATSLLLPSQGNGGFAVISSTLESPPRGIVLRQQSRIVNWLEHHQDTLFSEDFDIVTQLQSLSLTEKNSLEQMGARLYVPIKTRKGELAGVLILGSKLSQQSFSDEDKHLLTALSSQMAMALENARLYSDALRARESLERWLDGMTDCVMIVNIDYTVKFMNRAATDKLGSRVGENCWNATGKETVCPSCPIQNYVQGSREGLFYSQNIGDREYDIAAAPLSNSDGSLSIIEVLRDITERKQAEEKGKQLQQELNLSSRLASVGQMAAGIAHEINNPLTGVVGFSSLLMKKDIPEDIRKDVEIIYDGAQRVASITSRMLTFARQHKPERISVNINDIIETTLAMRAYGMESSNTKVATELDPDLPFTCVDAGQLQQVFLNIILNAEMEMRLIHGKGNLTVKTERIDNTIRVSFKDDGLGIPKENLDRIFDPFFTTRDPDKGTGLGLSICYSIVTQHGGKIYARSRLGKGATFFVELPIVTKEEQLEKAEPAIQPGKVSKARVLVVDDDTIVQEFLTKILREEGHEVEIVGNGDDALDRLGNENYDVILLDIKLPSMSGIELYRYMQKTVKSLARRVIFITGDVMSQDTIGFLSRTRAPYITKPFDAEQIKKGINHILGQQA